MTIRLHLLSGGGALDSWKSRIEGGFDQAIRNVSPLPPISDVDVIVYASPRVIPEIGLNGYSDTPYLMRLWFDPSHSLIRETFEKAFVSTFAHELHHCARARGPGYGSTLAEALVTEGLACHFEAEVNVGFPRFHGHSPKVAWVFSN